MCRVDLTVENGLHDRPRKTKSERLFFFLTAPVFSRPLLNQTAEVGGKVNFKCYVSGSPKPDIKWYKNGKIIINKSGLLNIIDRYVLYHCWM